MIIRDTLTAYLQQHLECDKYVDYAPNGLQIEGKNNIKRICTAVTASQEAIDSAIEQNADALLVHHGFFWRGENAVITGMKRRRIAQLMKHDVNLYAYHLPLDCHTKLGNNACIAQRLDIRDVQMHTAGKTMNLLWSGLLSTSMDAGALAEIITEKFQRSPLYVTGTTKPIQRLAWCSGAAQDFIEDAYHLGVDAYLSGEVSERTYYQAQELGIHYFACGHHASERYGIQALGLHLADHFDLQYQFIDSDNPV